jgi:hypothetical protein
VAGRADEVARLTHLVDVAENDAGSALGETRGNGLAERDPLVADFLAEHLRDDHGNLQGVIVMRITLSLNASSLCLDVVYPGAAR